MRSWNHLLYEFKRHERVIFDERLAYVRWIIWDPCRVDKETGYADQAAVIVGGEEIYVLALLEPRF